MKKVILIGALIAFVSACAGTKNARNRRAEEIRRSDQIMADSIRMPERREDLNKLAKVLSQNIKVEKNHFVFRLSRKEFKKTGLSEAYYDIILRNVKTNNKFIDDNRLDAAEAMRNSDFFKNPTRSF